MSINGAGQGGFTKNSLVLQGNTFANNTVWCQGATRLGIALAHLNRDLLRGGIPAALSLRCRRWLAQLGQEAALRSI